MPAGRHRRSALFIPATNLRAIAKARSLPCDAVILDLEDAVAAEVKASARVDAVEAIKQGFGTRETTLRVNAVDSRWFVDDLDAAKRIPVDAVLIPKVGSVREIEDVRSALGDGGPAIWAMIETARGLIALPGLVEAAERLKLTALVAGTNDLALDLRCRPTTDRAPLLPALAQIVAAARAGGLVALDGVLNSIDDSERLVAECYQGRDWGFDGKTLIHPSQIDAANRAFGPSPEEVEWATRVISAFATPENSARGVIRLDGAMVERLHLAEAERIMALAG